MRYWAVDCPECEDYRVRLSSSTAAEILAEQHRQKRGHSPEVARDV